MKHLLKYIIHTIVVSLSLLTFYSCSSEDSNDCLQTEGQIQQEEINLPEFNKIRVEEGVQLLLRQGESQQVILETGENLRSNVEVFLENETLVARDNNGCNLFRDYGVTKLIVTSPNIDDIINGSSYAVRSEGVLNYPTLRLRSLVIPGFDLRKNGDFYLTLDSQEVSIVANGSSVFYLNGTTTTLNVSFLDELPRLEAKELIAQNVTLRHVSSNHMYINPQESLTAELRGSGNVYSYNRPDIQEIQELYTGRVIFID
jgi:hypothetical protein